MSAERWELWIVDFRRDYVEARVEAGEAAEDAERAVTAQFVSVFPGGRPLSSHHFLDVTVGADVAGSVWTGPREDSSEEWWIYSIDIDLGHRRQGFGQDAMILAQDLAVNYGAVTMQLSVFYSNRGARRLYESLGYSVSAVRMGRDLRT